jgi:hypothetical protein
MKIFKIVKFSVFVAAFVIKSFILFGSSGVLAQEGGSTGILSDSLSDLYTVAGVGAAGSILGLSTLSFVDKPGENLKNIVTGGAIGIIIGVGIVAWSHATRSKNLYESSVFNRSSTMPNENLFDELRLFAEVNRRQENQSFYPQFTYHFFF